MERQDDDDDAGDSPCCAYCGTHRRDIVAVRDLHRAPEAVCCNGDIELAPDSETGGIILGAQAGLTLSETAAYTRRLKAAVSCAGAL
jgi:hypothetical protein